MTTTEKNSGRGGGTESPHDRNEERESEEKAEEITPRNSPQHQQTTTEPKGGSGPSNDPEVLTPDTDSKPSARITQPLSRQTSVASSDFGNSVTEKTRSIQASADTTGPDEEESTKDEVSPKKGKKRRYSRQTKKDPKAPKRFKSSFIFFAQSKYKEIENDLRSKGITDKTTVDITKMVSLAWRKLSEEEKGPYQEMSRKDKARFDIERSMYKGTWTVPVGQKRTQDIGAPKRPESAFLAFSNKKRAALKAEMPRATNGEISKMLSKMWNDAPDDVRKRYQEEELRLREKYKAAVSEWRQKEDAKLQQRQDDAMRLAEMGTRPGDHQNIDGRGDTPIIDGVRHVSYPTAAESSQAFARGPPLAGAVPLTTALHEFRRELSHPGSLASLEREQILQHHAQMAGVPSPPLPLVVGGAEVDALVRREHERQVLLESALYHQARGAIATPYFPADPNSLLPGAVAGGGLGYGLTNPGGTLSAPGSAVGAQEGLSAAAVYPPSGSSERSTLSSASAASETPPSREQLAAEMMLSARTRSQEMLLAQQSAAARASLYYPGVQVVVLPSLGDTLLAQEAARMSAGVHGIGGIPAIGAGTLMSIDAAAAARQRALVTMGTHEASRRAYLQRLSPGGEHLGLAAAAADEIPLRNPAEPQIPREAKGDGDETNHKTERE